MERIFGTINQMCLPSLPGYAPRGTADRAGQARLTLAELDAAIGTFIREVYNITPHSETGMPPQQRWEAAAFIPRMPDSLEQLDLLLLTVAKPRKIHRTGSTSRGCATWIRCWPPTSATPWSSAMTHGTWPRSGSSPVPDSCAGPSAQSWPGPPSASKTSPPPATPAGAASPGACASGPASWTGYWPPTRTSSEAVAAITRTTSENFRLTCRLVAQVKRVLDINHLSVVTREVVEAARESLVIGVM